jgi:HSP20 family protein
MLSLRFAPLRELQDELDRVRGRFDQLFGESRGGHPQLDPTGFPALNAWEDEQSFIVEAELPGLALSDLEILMADQNTLTIKGERKQPTTDGGSWHRRERAYGAFERSLELPGAVDTEHVEASLKNGVLTIKLPKAPQIRPRKIEVKSA